MTPPTRRDIERRLDQLDGDGSMADLVVAYRDPRTGDLEDLDGRPVDPENHGAETLVVIEETMVCKRERAESNGWEILGPATEAIEPGFVRVPADDYRALPDDDTRDGVTAK